MRNAVEPSFPATLIQGGTREYLMSDFIREYQAIRMGGGEAVLDLYEGMPHVFQSYLSTTPEGRQAYIKLAREVDPTGYTDKQYDELYDFYFMKSHGQDVLHVRTKDYFPGELTIVLGDVPIQQIKTVLRYFLPFREYVKPSFVDKADPCRRVAVLRSSICLRFRHQSGST